MERNYLAHREGDAANAVLAAAGYNFRRLIRWLRLFLSLILGCEEDGFTLKSDAGLAPA
jgi:IS5 family transposase